MPALGAKNGFLSTSSHDSNGMSMSPICVKQARATIWNLAASHCRATAPAATTAAVTRAEERPPPR